MYVVDNRNIGSGLANYFCGGKKAILPDSRQVILVS